MKTYYAKQIDDIGNVSVLHCFESDEFPTSPYFVEITEEEYNTLLADVKTPEPETTNEISDAEALNIILGGDL